MMKKVLVLFLSILLCFCMVSCDNKDESAAGEGASQAATGESGAGSLSGKTALLPSSITYRDADGTSYVMQTIEIEGSVAKSCLYYNYNGTTSLSSGYEVDLAKTNPFELSLLRAPESDGTVDPGMRRFTVSEDGTSILKESAYRLSEGINSTTDYAISYDSEGRIEKVIIKDKYIGDESSESEEVRLYQYGETGYTISYLDASWTQYNGDTKVLRHRCYEIPYEGDEIVLTETYCTEDGAVCYPDDFHTNSDVTIEKLVYKINRQGFCTGNTLYFTNGHTISNRDFHGNLNFTAEFNESGMPIKFVSTSIDDATDAHTSTFTYDDKGNLISYHEESDSVNFTMELEWQEFPAELQESFAAIFNCSNFAIREVIEDNCPDILLGPQELIYQKDAICR